MFRECPIRYAPTVYTSTARALRIYESSSTIASFRTG